MLDEPPTQSVEWPAQLSWIWRYTSFVLAVISAWVAYYAVFVLHFTLRGYLTLLGAILLGNGSRSILGVGYRTLHECRAEYANFIVNSAVGLAEAARSRPLFLMIRSFSGDYTRIVENEVAILGSPFNPLKYLGFELRPIEARLTKAVQKWRPILAFSEPAQARPFPKMLRNDYMPGYAKLPDAIWFEKFNDVARLSTGIIAFPSATESFLKELKMIVSERYLEKTIFVMSPEAISPIESLIFAILFRRFLPTRSPTVDENTHRQSRFWEAARRECSALGVELPPYNRRGLIFAYSNNVEIKDIKMFNQNKKATFNVPTRLFILRTTLKTLLLGRIPATPPRAWESR